jgi:pyruvate dehydrogenase E1 component alpha subunit
MSAGEGAAARAHAAGVPSESVDGMDVEAVHAVAERLVTAVRAGEGPRLLHAKTYRFKGHVSVDPAAYRDPAEVARALQGDPLPLVRERLLARKVSAELVQSIQNEALAEVRAAVAEATEAPWPDPAVAFTDIQDVGAGRWA